MRQVREVQGANVSLDLAVYLISTVLHSECYLRYDAKTGGKVAPNGFCTVNKDG
jgi:hypothetical protein